MVFAVSGIGFRDLSLGFEGEGSRSGIVGFE